MATLIPETSKLGPAIPVTNREKIESDIPSSAPTIVEQDNVINSTKPEQDGHQDEPEYLSGWKLVSLMVAITLSAFLMLLDMSIIVTAIPSITSDFHSLRDIGWYGSAYNLASAALQPLSGKLYTYFKAKWLFLGFLFLFEVGCLICGLSSSSIVLIIGRVISGIGSSGIMNGALTIIAVSTPLEKRPSLMGVLMACAQLGLVTGPLVGGALTEYTTWRWCFYINLPIGAVATILIFLVHIPEHQVKSSETVMQILGSKLDLTGFALFAPCIVMLLLALQWGGVDYAWDSATIIGLFVGGAVILIIFIYWEHRVGIGAMIPLPIIRKREIWTACLTMLFLFVTVFIAAFYLPIYFQSIKEASPFMSGVYMLPGILSQLVIGISGGFLAQKVGYYLPFAVVGAVVAAIANGLLSTMGPYTSTAKWAGYQIIMGVGRGLSMQMPILAVQANAAPEMISVATAVLVFSQTFGGAVFIAVANVIFNNTLRDELVARIPHIDAELVINAGAAAVRQVVEREDLPEALMAYSKGVSATFLLAVGASGAWFIFAWGIGWMDIRKKKPASQGEA